MRTFDVNSKTEKSQSATPNLKEEVNSPFFTASAEPATPFFGLNTIQPKLEIGQPNDKYEKEADLVADQVMKMADTEIQLNSPSYEKEERLQQKPAIQHSGEGAQTASPEISNRISVTRGSGYPLPQDMQRKMESKMGADFSGVKVHADITAEQLSRDIGAKAFTVGNDIYFNKGQYDPVSREGKKLMAHELVHTVQQRAVPEFPMRTAGDLIQREPPALGAPAPVTEPVQVLSEEDRDWLKERIGFRMGIAYTKFANACNEHQRRLRKVAARQTETAGLVLDVFLGFAAPGMGRLIAAGISGVVETEAPLAVYRLALGALDRKDQIVSAAGRGAKAATMTKVQNVLSRGRSEEFVEKLKQEMSVAVDNIHSTLPSRTDKELSILYLNYDPSEASTSYYERQIGWLIDQYESQVVPIGERTDGRYGQMKARWIEGARWKALALTGEGRYFNVSGPEFITWISPQMRRLAINATEALGGGTVGSVHYNALVPNSQVDKSTFSFLDSSSGYVSRCGLVVERLPRVQPSGGSECRSCHGDSGRRPLTTGRDYNFDFPMEPIQENLLQEWIEAVKKDKK